MAYKTKHYRYIEEVNYFTEELNKLSETRHFLFKKYKQAKSDGDTDSASMYFTAYVQIEKFRTFLSSAAPCNNDKFYDFLRSMDVLCDSDSFDPSFNFYRYDDISYHADLSDIHKDAEIEKASKSVSVKANPSSYTDGGYGPREREHTASNRVRGGDRER